jgi:hypothetical protein
MIGFRLIKRTLFTRDLYSGLSGQELAVNDVEANETESWRIHDRAIQGLTTQGQRRAQAVVDVGESAKLLARQRGSNPLDDLLELYHRVASPAAKAMVADSLRYVKIELDLIKPWRGGGIAFDAVSNWPSTIR